MRHYDLINLGIKLGYQIDIQGLCFGFSGMWSQAVCNQSLPAFYKRMALLEKYKDRPELLLQEIQRVRNLVKQKIPLTPDQIAFLEIPAFFEGIILFQSPHNNTEIFNDRVFQIDISSISKFTQPQSTKSDLHTIFNHTDQYDKNELIQFLINIADTIHSQPNFAIIFGGTKHAVSARCIGKNQFEFIDTNGKTNGINHIQSQKLTCKELAETLLKNTFGNNSKLVLTTKLITSGPQEILLEKPTSEITTLDFDYHGNTILHKAAVGNDLATLKRIDFSQVDINLGGIEGKTPLELACISNAIDTINFLLGQPNIKVNTQSPFSFSNFRSLIEYRNFDIALTLIDHNDFNALDIDCHGTHLHSLAMCTDTNTSTLEIAKRLLKKGCNLNAKNKGNGELTAFHLACFSGNVQLARLFVENGANPFELTGLTKSSALHLATDPAMIEYLLELGLDINLQSGFGYTPLHSISDRAPSNSIQLLLDKNPKNCNLRARDGEIPFILACQGSNIPAIQLLLPHTQLSMTELENDDLYKAMAKCDVKTQQSFIIDGLKTYIDERKKEGSTFFSDFLNYIGIGYSPEEKINATTALLNSLLNPDQNQSINPDVLNNGRLSKLYSFICKFKKEMTCDGSPFKSSYTKTLQMINAYPTRPLLPLPKTPDRNPTANTLENSETFPADESLFLPEPDTLFLNKI